MNDRVANRKGEKVGWGTRQMKKGKTKKQVGCDGADL